ncbi:M56 family metallopeptidase [Siphonobacter sp. SORGH_AS_1065]|uniref:M56 family metallopeptidase n=1 Tax=Siphonobacter sp. SORGH_AS_1065 TaxID=3041795 RepID=UPI0027876600|nr:M56 family metallopeptidase [Siphonobacter sp. SORGH_AS_1065]MDQ1087649.1 TonB family protein [Siphonobacter sp. SORGH_AS_1065]
MNWLHYLLQVNLYLAGFYGFYRLILRKETFHQLNRSFLLAGTALAFFIPAMQSDWIRTWLLTQQVNESLYTYYNPGVVFITPDYLDNSRSAHPMAWGHLLAVAYLCGILILLGRFAFRLMRLGDLVRYRTNRKVDQNMAFAFFNHFFVGKNLSNRRTIEMHERVHVRQLHSADVIFFELIAIMNWFNPVVYFLKQDICLIHEYLADEVASRLETSRADYAMLLFSQQFGVQQMELAHTFFNKSFLKARISMLKQKPSQTSALVKYALIVPVFGSMIFLATACAQQEKKEELVIIPIETPAPAQTNAKEEVFTVVEKQAQFPGGDSEMYRYLSQHVKYPAAAQRANVEGKVFTSFIVEKDGSITDVEIMKGIGFGCDEEVLRIMKDMPKWKPGYHSGHAVRSRFNLPITFTME